MKYGVPYDVALSMDDDMRLAHCVILGRLEGSEWSWKEMRWIPPRD